MKAELIPDNGDPPIPITRDLTVIGRKEGADVIIDHPSLSKLHCVIVKTDGLLVIRDLVTTNGTKVKGQRVRWAALLPGDRLALGGYRMRVYLGPDDATPPSELYLRRSGRANEIRRAQDALKKVDPNQARRFGSFAAPSVENLRSDSFDNMASVDSNAAPPDGDDSPIALD